MQFRLAAAGALLFTIQTVQAVNITFASDARCGGNALYGNRDPKHTEINCYDLSTYPSAQSVLVSDIDGYSITFYADHVCQHNISQVTLDSCVDFEGNLVNSFALRRNNATDLTTRDSSITTDLVLYGVKLADYSTLGLSPSELNKRAPHLVHNLGMAVTGAMTAASIYVAVGSCTITDGVVAAVDYCIIGIICIVFSLASSLVHHVSKPKLLTLDLESGATQQNDIQLTPIQQAAAQAAANAAWNANQGNQQRDLVPRSNFDYLRGIVGNDSSDSDWFQTGWMDYDAGNNITQRSPVFRRNTDHAVGNYHLTAYYNEDLGNFEHHVELADEPLHAALAKRAIPSFNTFRKQNSGIKFAACPFNSGTSSFWSQDETTIYNSLFQQLQCLSAKSFESATGIVVDFYGDQGEVITSGMIVAWDNGRPQDASFAGLPPCPTTWAPPLTIPDC